MAKQMTLRIPDLEVRGSSLALALALALALRQGTFLHFFLFTQVHPSVGFVYG